MAPFFTELYCQISNVGYNSILTEKLVNDFSYSKNMKFYITLFLFSLGFGIAYSPSNNSAKEKEEKEEKEKKTNDNTPFNYLSFISLFLFGFTLII